MIKRHWLAFPLVLAMLGHTTRGMAAPATVFAPYLEQIRQNIPPGWAMRLPGIVLLGGPADEDFVDSLYVRVNGSSYPPTMNVSLFSCQSGPFPCLVGSFSADSQASANAQRDFQEHQFLGTAYSLIPGVRGYLLEGHQKQPPSPFSTVMWAQDRMLYTASFLAAEQENLLIMAVSMAQEAPIYRIESPVQMRPLLPF